MSAPPRPPADFSEILSGDDLPLIVGGQAVNLWAGLYAGKIPQLHDYAPFTSQDADIYGNRALAASLAARSGWVCHFTNDPASVSVAILVKPTETDESPLTIEVLKEVNGLTEADLTLDTVIELGCGGRYRTPAPLVLLKAKLYNLVSLANLDRPQDIRHTKMLLQIIPAYLNELCLVASEETITGAVRYAGDVVLAPFAGNASRSHHLDFTTIFPTSLRLNGPTTIRNAIDEICRRLAESSG